MTRSLGRTGRHDPHQRPFVLALSAEPYTQRKVQPVSSALSTRADYGRFGAVCGSAQQRNPVE
jgi:hypothetical protein